MAALAGSHVVFCSRRVSSIRQDGMLVAGLTRHIVGPAREDPVLDQPQAGPSCIEG